MQGCGGMVAQTLKPVVFLESVTLACAGYLFWQSSTHTPDILGNYISIVGIVVLLCGFIFGASWLSARDPVHSDMVVYSRSSGRAMRDHEQDTPVYIPGNLRLLIASTLLCAVNIGLGVLLHLV